MHDLKLVKLFPIANWESLEQLSFWFRGCSRAAAAYANNLKLVHSLAMVPGYSFLNGETWGAAIVRAMRELDSENPDDPKVGRRASEIFDSYEAMKADDSTIRDFYEATDNAAKMASLPGRTDSHGALHGLLKHIVIQGWSAFEILARDLWTETTRFRPLLGNGITKKEWRAKCGHGSLKRILGLYSCTFRHDNAVIQSVLTDKSLLALSLARNLLIHKGGRIDLEFRKRRRGVPGLYPIKARKLRASVKFDGELVRSLIDQATPVGYSLLKAVDYWIQTHP